MYNKRIALLFTLVSVMTGCSINNIHPEDIEITEGQESKETVTTESTIPVKVKITVQENGAVDVQLEESSQEPESAVIL